MDIASRLVLVKEVGEEVISEEELLSLFETKKHPMAYDGFEPSGTLHIAQGLLRTINVNKMIQAGCKFTMLAADWHAWANNKMGGDLDKIRTVGDYMVEVWKACGMDLDNVTFKRSSDLVTREEYWKTVMQIARHNTVQRLLRCADIMGREEHVGLQGSQLLYPCMQAADIFELGVDIAQLGMDQRKVNMLAREVAPKLGYEKPVCVHHHMLMGLGQPPALDVTGAERAIALKMSKSKPETAIFMTDSAELVSQKIKNAYCPMKQIEDNPLFEYARYVIFQKYPSITITRPAKWGGDLELHSYTELCDLYMADKVHPMDVKAAIGRYTNELLEPVRKHFEKNKKAADLLKLVKSFEVTR
ncbi:tyrosine--tRNA ligase [Candidatus Woesearchaeota archaeon]|nr:tyrosine--tRNA ligase [Candidatus Woesearchaeota archaeon]